jgi:MAF protein
LNLVLASASPRRHELLSALGVDFEVVISGVDETPGERERPERLVRRLARAKALDVAAHHPDAAVLAADTTVVDRGLILNKPADAAEARWMLTRLRGRRHRVITGVALAFPGRRVRIEHVVSGVLMRDYSDAEIEASITSGDPFDKAGGYAIQHPGFRPVEAFEGCYCNVVGLPLWTTLAMLRECGIAPGELAMPGACVTCPIAPDSGEGATREAGA